jgi:hypothetical protein
MHRFRFLAITLLTFVPFAMARATDQDTQYICTFQAKVQMVSLSVASPTSVTKPDKKRFTFIDSGNASGSYINLDIGTKSPAIVVRNRGYTVFLEDLGGVADNHFIVTIFENSRENRSHRAIMSLHSDVAVEFYNPYQSVGECIKIL